ncbi:MAG: hypothetical protein ABL885_05340 [Methylophilaceae bacterium]
MSLANLLKIKQLQLHSPSNEALLRLLDAIKRNIEDSQVEAVSGETRFDAAYKAIMQCAMLGLWLNRAENETSRNCKLLISNHYNSKSTPTNQGVWRSNLSGRTNKNKGLQLTTVSLLSF